jgi:UDP-glucose:(heptosyl)LPS alpha-1,3-glucosyltransferase
MRTLATIKKEDHSQFRLLVLERDRKEPYLRLLRRIGISEETVFAGSTDEPEKYYRAEAIFVHPSFCDTCFLTVLEALASGLPVVTTSTTGASGILNHGEDGFVIRKMRDLEELKMAIKHFFKENIRHHASYLGRMKAEMH